MNAKEMKIIVEYAPTADFGGKFAEYAGDLADLLHARKTGQIFTDCDHVAALILWQARMFNGEWDAKALQEVIEWIQWKVQVTDIEVITPRATHAMKVKKVGTPEVVDPRFSNLEM